MKLNQRQHLIWVLWSGLLLKATCETEHGNNLEISIPTSQKHPEGGRGTSQSGASVSSPLPSRLHETSSPPSTELPSSIKQTNELKLTDPLEHGNDFSGAIENFSGIPSETTQGYKTVLGFTMGGLSSVGATTQKIDPPDDKKSTIINSQNKASSASSEETESNATLESDTGPSNAKQKINTLKKTPQFRSLSTPSLKKDYSEKQSSNSVIDDTTSRILATMALVNKDEKINNLQPQPEIIPKIKQMPTILKFTRDDAVTPLFGGSQSPSIRTSTTRYSTFMINNPQSSERPPSPSSVEAPLFSTPNLESKPPFANTILYSEDNLQKQSSTPYYSERGSVSASQTTESQFNINRVSLGSTDTAIPKTTEDASVNTVDVKSKSEEVSKPPSVVITKSSSTVRIYTPSEIVTTQRPSTIETTSGVNSSISSLNTTSDIPLTSDYSAESSMLSNSSDKWLSGSSATGQTTLTTSERPGSSSTVNTEHSFASTGISNFYPPISESVISTDQTTRRMGVSVYPFSIGYTTIASSYSVSASTVQSQGTPTSEKTFDSSKSLLNETSKSDETLTFSSLSTSEPSSGTLDISSSTLSSGSTMGLPGSPSDLPSSTSVSRSTVESLSSTSNPQGSTSEPPSSSSDFPSSITVETILPSTGETDVLYKSSSVPSTSKDYTSTSPNYSFSHDITVTTITSRVSQIIGETLSSTTPMPPSTSIEETSSSNAESSEVSTLGKSESTTSPPETSSTLEPSSETSDLSSSIFSSSLTTQSQSHIPTTQVTTLQTEAFTFSSKIPPTTTDSTVPKATDSEGTVGKSSPILVDTVTTVSTTTRPPTAETEHEDELNPDVSLNGTSLDSPSGDDLESDIDEAPDKDHGDPAFINETDLGGDYTTTQGTVNDTLAASSTPSGLATKHLATQGSYDNIDHESPDTDLFDGVVIPPRVIRLKINASQNDVCLGKEQLRDSIVKMFKVKQRTLDKSHIAFLNLDKGSCSPRVRSANAIVDLQFKDSRGQYDRDLTDMFFSLYDKGYLQYKYAVTEVSEKGLEGIDPAGNDLPSGTSASVIAAIAVSSIAAACLFVLTILLVILRKRQKGFNYGQRCTPVSLDDYSLDNISVYNSVRRKAHRASKRSYGNPAFEDPGAISHPVNFALLANFVGDRSKMNEEFSQIATVAVKPDELPEGAEVKNRYANVIPLPETRVQLKGKPGDTPVDQYINANYVKGVKGADKFYIACQAPLSNTVSDFWQMIWEQQSRMIIMLTDLVENGAEKCANYLPASEVLDCHRVYGDLQVTLKRREVREKYIISHLQLKNLESNLWREVTHMWFVAWPLQGVPEEASSVIAFLVEARSYIKSKESSAPIVVHCSPGTGRTGTIIAIDIAIREFETNRSIDIPKTVYGIRRNRAGAVQTKDQYAFIYKVLHLYATKLTGGALDSI